MMERLSLRWSYKWIKAVINEERLRIGRQGASVESFNIVKRKLLMPHSSSPTSLFFFIFFSSEQYIPLWNYLKGQLSNFSLSPNFFLHSTTLTLTPNQPPSSHRRRGRGRGRGRWKEKITVEGLWAF